MAEVKAVSRVEAIQSGDDIKPVSREEYYLKKSIGQGGGSGGAGYTVETQSVAVVPEQTVTTVMPEGRPFVFGQINIAEGITYNDIPDTLTITFNGQEYVCSSISSDSPMKNYGAPMVDGVPDWSQYPFIVSFELETGNVLVTESAGTYTVKATEEQKTVTPSDEFKDAVSSVVGESLKVVFDYGNAITLLNNPDLSAGEIFTLIAKTMQSKSGLVEAYIQNNTNVTVDEFRATHIEIKNNNTISFCFLTVNVTAKVIGSNANFESNVYTLRADGTVSHTATQYAIPTATS